MRAHPILQPVVDRPDIQIDCLDAAERTLHPSQGFVAAHGIGVAEGLDGQAGAHDIRPIGCRLGSNFGGLSRKAEGGVGDRQIEMVFHFVVEHRTDRKRDFRGAAQRITLAADGSLDAAEALLGRRQQFFTLAAALGGEVGITANHQSLAGIIRGGDGGHIALVEQRQLQGATVQQFLDRRCTQRRDPVQACGFDVLGDARLGDHAAVADQHHVVEAKALLELVDLRPQRRGPQVVGIVSSESNVDQTRYNTLMTTAAFNQIEQWVKADDATATTSSLPATPSGSLV
jgi:hypothetical protein